MKLYNGELWKGISVIIVNAITDVQYYILRYLKFYGVKTNDIYSVIIILLINVLKSEIICKTMHFKL